jgi:uncharacterized protein (DUF427 family)
MHDAESKEWVERLRSGHPRHAEAVAKLRGVLVRAARHELSRRRGTLGSIAGPEFDELAQRAADDALMNVLRKLDEFRGLSRVTTWAYKFVISAVPSNAARHAWRRQPPSGEEVAWDRLPDWLAPRPGDRLAWRAMDAFYEEDERVLGHAADPYHRIDVRRSSRHLVVRSGDRVVADTNAPLVLYESGFAPRWYVPRADVVGGALRPVEGQTFCPYKGLASYYDIGDARNAAWSYRAPFEAMARIADLVSFEPDKVTITIDGDKLEPAPGQTVLPHGPDRNLSVDEIGGIQLVDTETPAGARA